MSTATATLYRQPSPDGLLRTGKAVALLLALGLCFNSSRTFSAPAARPGQLLIKTRTPAAGEVLATHLKGTSIRYQKQLKDLGIHVVQVTEDKVEAMLELLKRDPEIEFAEPDGLGRAAFVPNDPFIATGQEWHLARVEAYRAWSASTGAAQVVVAVLDSGVNAAHPDLAGRVLAGYDFVSNRPDAVDDFGHGTAVTGVIVAGGNNGFGVAGIAYGASVLPVKVVDSSGFAAYSTIAEGIQYAVGQGARVINISIAGSTPSLTLQAAIDYAWAHDVLVIAAAGNSGASEPQYPAACNHVLAVSATAADDTVARFSTFGSAIALAAPGDNIWTTTRDLSNPYTSWRGTSFSSPIVAGVGALLISANNSLSNTQLVSLLEQSADDLGPAGWDPSSGYGRVNAAKALALAGFTNVLAAENSRGPVTPEDNTPPTLRLLEAPVAGARLLFSALALSGVAADDVQVAKVELALNNGPFETLSGTTNWQAAVQLMPGTNTVRLRSVDTAGNLSAEWTRSFFCVAYARLTVLTNGLGRVAPNLDGAQLEIGRTYRVRAIPGPGQVFAGWHDPASQGAVLQFVMQPNLTLVAAFVPTPFTAVEGTYAGLVGNTNSALPESSGAFFLSVNRSGLFSGRLVLGGQRYCFSGQFNLCGDARVSVRRCSLDPVQLDLNLDLQNGTNAVQGTIREGGWIVAVAGQRNIFNRCINPAPQVGTRAFVFEHGLPEAAIAGTGLARIYASGAVAVRGRLKDGRPFVSSSTLGQNGDYPLYLSFNRGTEVVIGWINFPADRAPAPSGTVIWVNTGTNGFAATLQVAAVPAEPRQGI